MAHLSRSQQTAPAPADREARGVQLDVERISFRYRIAERPALAGIDLRAAPGEIVLLAGGSGSGKSTLLRAINGLVPRSYRGELHGAVRVGGRDTARLSLAQIAQLVGTLLQDPEKQIVASYVAEEVAFGLENLRWPREQIVAAVDAALEELGIAELKGRETFQLSGGEKQKVALAGLVAMAPRVLLLDEPLASLDPLAARSALEVIRAQAERGRSVLLVEHRVEDALRTDPAHALVLDEGKQTYAGNSAGLLEAVDPRVVKLPAPIAVRRLGELDARTEVAPAPAPPAGGAGEPLVAFEQVEFWYDDERSPVLKGVSLEVRKGDVIALLGPNGSGKSTLVKHALGLNRPKRGRVLVAGQDARTATTAQLARTVGYVFQSPTHMLFAPTVAQELAFGPRNLGFDEPAIARATARALEATGLADTLERAPLSLSFGQQKRVGIAAVMAMQSRVLVMDEPTAGQDYGSYTRFMDEVTALRGFDAVLFVTHDLDLALTYANRVVLLDDGAIAGDGAPELVLRDLDLLRRCHVLPTSLLELNLQLLPRTGRVMGVAQLASWLRSAGAASGIQGTETIEGLAYQGGTYGHQ